MLKGLLIILLDYKEIKKFTKITLFHQLIFGVRASIVVHLDAFCLF